MKKLATILLSACALCLSVLLVGCGGGVGSGCEDGHVSGQYVDSIKPTCTEPGYSVYHCTACDEDYRMPDGSEALGHYVDRYIYDNNHTCTANGTESGKCLNCGETATKEVADTAKHEWENSAFCKHCGTEPYRTRNLKFTLNEDQTGYIVSWSIHSAAEVVSMLQNGTAAKGCETMLCIPSTYEGLPVVEIATDGFNGEIAYSYENVPDWESTLEAAGYTDYANIWNYNNSLIGIKYVYIPSSVKVINDRAFYRMSIFAGAKFTLELSEGVERIGNDAFYYSGVAGKLTLPSTLTSLGEGAFNTCSYLEELELKCDKLTTVPSRAFCSAGLRKLTLPSFVTVVEPHAFDCYQLLTVTIESDELTVHNNAFSYTVNTLINKTDRQYDINEISAWFSGSNEHRAFRDEDPNRSVTATAKVMDNKFENGVHVGTADFEREVIFYYSHLGGENILTNVVRPAGVLKELTVPNGITVIGDGVISDIYCDKVTLPESLKSIGYVYGFRPAKLIASEYTDLSALNIDTSVTEVTLTESENMVKVDIYDIWDSLNAGNGFSYTQEGVTFKFSLPGGGDMSTAEGTVFPNSNPHVWFINGGLKIELSLGEGDERRAIYLGILGNNSSGSINDGVQVAAYYYDSEAGEYKKVATSYQFDVDPDEFSWVENGVEYDYGNGGWYFELNNTVDYGYKLRSLYIKFTQSYNADLTEG